MGKSTIWTYFRRRFLIVALLVLVLGLVFYTSTTYENIRWNLGNIFLNKAIGATEYDPILRNSTKAIDIFQAFSPEETQERLEEAYRLQWLSSSNLELQDTSLAAYTQGNPISGGASPAACDDSLLYLEAELFGGIGDDFNARQRWVGDRLSVVLFASNPISQVVCIPSPGLYQIDVTALEGRPEPIIFDIEWDNWHAGKIAFTKGDDSWSTKSINLASSAGSHNISLNLANDFSDPVLGIDRNGYLDIVEVRLIKP